MKNETEMMYRECFSRREHKATVVFQNEDFLVLDWRKASGGSDYFVRYIVDINLGSLIIQGDLGHAIACWFNKVTPKQMYSYIRDEEYFAGKLRCTSDLYSYREENIVEDLNQLRIRMLINNDPSECDEINEDFDNLVRLVREDDLECYFERNAPMPEEVAEIFDKYYDWDEAFYACGKRLKDRVYLWIAGYRMACEQLGIVEVKK